MAENKKINNPVTSDSIKVGQCFRFKGQKSIWLKDQECCTVQIIGNRKGMIKADWDFDDSREVEIVKVVEKK